jgi:UDP:flavonoid glycosyltransferase YjiC (YdhE family)
MTAAGGTAGERRRILFVTSNGTGLGHLTRAMAIARRLDERFQPLMLTLSAAAPVVRELGFPVEYVASHATIGAGADYRWSRRLRGRLRAAIAEAAPAALVFDGAHPYQALIDAMAAAPRMRRVWCRRALWKPGSNPGAIDREQFFGAVLEPGELAADLDRGVTVAGRGRARVVDPVVYLDDDELLPRREAERALELEPGRTNVLVQLGQGEEVRATAARSLRHLAARDDVQLAALSSALEALDDVPAGVVHLQATYPISRYFAAFDAAVSAAGYNAYHELIRFRVPSLYVPMTRQTDDQAARARYAEEQGLGLAAEPGSADLEQRLDDLLEPGSRGAMKARCDELRGENGAAQAAAWLTELVEAPASRQAPVSRWRKYLRSPASSLRRAAPFVARMPVHAAAFIKQTIERPQPRTIVFALGLEDGRLEEELAEVLKRTPDPPQHVLVITDSLDFAPLRAAGVGFEHVPARGEPQAELAGDYDAFLRRRAELILAERRQPKRTLATSRSHPVP